MSDIVDRYQKVDIGEYPDVHLLADDLDVVLWVMLVGSEKLGLTEMTAAQVADVATHGFLRPLSRQHATAMLTSANGAVIRKPRSSPVRFVLMKWGINRIREQQMDVLLIDPMKAFTASQRLDELLNGLKGYVLLCDPYVDDNTLVVLSSISTSCGIKLLTLNISDPAKFRQRFVAYTKEFGNVELRVSSTPDIHDRYLIDASRMWLIGTSLNGIGKKQSFIITVGPDVRGLTEQGFNKRWNQSTKWQ